MSNFKVIDSLLNSYLQKYGASIPTFNATSELPAQSGVNSNVSLSTANSIKVIEHTAVGAKKTENRTTTQENNYVVGGDGQNCDTTESKRLKHAELNDISIHSNKASSINTSQSLTETKSHNVYVPFSQMVPDKQFTPRIQQQQSYEQQIQNLIQQQLEAKMNIQKANRQQSEVTKLCRPATSKQQVSQREVYSLLQEINKLKATLLAKNQTIRELKGENARLAKTAGKKKQVGSKRGVLETELEAAMKQINYLKQENLRLQSLVHGFIDDE